MIKSISTTFVLAVICGCIPPVAAASVSNDTARVGMIVADVNGLLLSEDIGKGNTYKLRGGPAIVIETAEKNSERWYRLLGPEGTYGWTKRLLRVAGKAELIVLKQGTRIARFPLRDDPDFHDKVDKQSEWTQVSTDEPFAVTGATTNSNLDYPDGFDYVSPLSIPAPNIFHTPSLKIKNSYTAGWIGISNSFVNWSEMKSEKTTESMSEKLVRYHYEGMVSTPFLGPVIDDLRSFSPKVGSTSLHLSRVGAEPVDTKVVTSEWGNPELLILSSHTKKSTPSTLVVYPKGRNRAFTFIAEDKILAQIVVDEYAPQISSFRIVDLDNDGFNEWLLEINTAYGDGSYRTIWIVDGKSSSSKVELYQHSIDEKNYESSGGVTHGYWWLDNSNGATLFWQIEIDGKKTTAAPFRYKNGKFSMATKLSRVYAVLSTKQVVEGLHPIGIHNGKSIINFQGRLFIRESEAKNWLKSTNFSSSDFSIRSLPVAKIYQ